ncbi:MAG TPA: isocitrate/isopropylmalate dehydrogenase family protein [Thermomicrobiales bacterium]|jgi:isocitrate dehydrogenase (NAD+)|nr:isocitrate dehydrogenase [Chloroflexota bacterium]HQZ89692.1 isocitrate/isopropylmalate dehydrogenase family protein [Thermomicrobiales bacterium]HRA33112.1 isocitrate/isopropylmalate dehydrogenase family protein [Thermomicrobiales bacterium]
MAYQVTLIPGDGIGPEVSTATRRVLEATGIAFEWDVQEAGMTALEKSGDVLPDAVLESIRKNSIALKGPLTTPLGGGFRSVNVALRHALDLYVNLRPARTYEGVRSVFSNIDLVVVRENMEDLYAGVEFDTGQADTKELIDTINRLSPRKVPASAAISIKSITPENSERIVRYAFDYAVKNERKLVTAVHKANIMKFSDGLFLRVSQEVAKDYPQIEYNDRIVDNMCMQLVQRPEDYDVLVMPNLYGDVLSDLTAGMVGGLGVAPSANIGEYAAIFEPIHGSAPTHAGKNEANPSATILSGAMMLRHMGELSAAKAVEAAVAEVVKAGTDVTYDLRPDRDRSKATGTSEMADAIIRRLAA